MISFVSQLYISGRSDSQRTVLDLDMYPNILTADESYGSFIIFLHLVLINLPSTPDSLSYSMPFLKG
jgi:hypothetical protein